MSAAQLRTALSITDIAAVTAHYNVAVRLGADVRRGSRGGRHRLLALAPRRNSGGGEDGRPFRAVIDPIAAKHDATPQQIALAWQLHRTPQALPIPGTTNVQHLEENLAAAHVELTHDEVDAITALAPED